jgi:hypothetical protein
LDSFYGQMKSPIEMHGDKLSYKHMGVDHKEEPIEEVAENREDSNLVSAI